MSSFNLGHPKNKCQCIVNYLLPPSVLICLICATKLYSAMYYNALNFHTAQKQYDKLLNRKDID